ncbi:hypothetical protein [Streptomyces sp. V3I7]|uniref:hypothetical protein n=1 Tax=Streptomyces sp. V3I7 TaxID=3042278 RepID=UPI00277D1F5E|nr:hypothetical protein [Streptomyces sp. V3I7]MDQ0993325.1 hypothetical protein [Streptomyces sp. V3I7]
MLALRLTRAAHPAVHLRRLLVATAAAGTGFLLLAALGYALVHPEAPTASVLRLAWCAVPLAATVQFAVSVARTDPATRPRPGLSAVGLGPARLMAVSVVTTALSCTLGSMVALLFFLHLRGDLTGLPFDGAAAEFLAAGEPLPLPAALTLLGLVPVIASGVVALTLRPRDVRPAQAGQPRGYGRFGAYGRSGSRETFGAYGRFGARLRVRTPVPAGHGADGAASAEGTSAEPAPERTEAPAVPAQATELAEALRRPSEDPPAPARETPAGLPWGIAVLAAGLAVEAYASRSVSGPVSTLPGGLAAGPLGVLVGWAVTAVGLVLAAPGLTYLCGRLLQAVRPGALRLLAGRGLMAEANRIGRPLGVVCAVASGVYAMTALYDDTAPSFGPLTVLGAVLVSGCAVATLLMAAVETRQSRADTVAALLRLGAPARTLRSAAALRGGALFAMFAPLTLVIAALAALPLAR